MSIFSISLKFLFEVLPHLEAFPVLFLNIYKSDNKRVVFEKNNKFTVCSAKQKLEVKQNIAFSIHCFEEDHLQAINM